MTVKLRDNSEQQKREPGAYISRAGVLYHVRRFEATGSNSGMLWATLIDKHGEMPVRLTAKEVGEADLVKVAPSLDLPEAV